MTTLTGSALLALAHAHGRLDAEATWAAAHVDEDWQIAKWGEDAEAKARRQRRWLEMQAASRHARAARRCLSKLVSGHATLPGGRNAQNASARRRLPPSHLHCLASARMISFASSAVSRVCKS